MSNPYSDALRNHQQRNHLTMPDPTPNRPPLWEVMYLAQPFPELPNPSNYAAEIRAIADWLVPEEESFYTFVSFECKERSRLRALLLAEADRAEAGDAAD